MRASILLIIVQVNNTSAFGSLNYEIHITHKTKYFTRWRSLEDRSEKMKIKKLDNGPKTKKDDINQLTITTFTFHF